MLDDLDSNETMIARFEALGLDPRLPLLVCDADGVLIEFARPLARFLERRGLALEFESFALAGNIRKKACGSPLTKEEIAPLILAFLEEEVDRPALLEGAAEAISRLRAHLSLIVLTNVPHALRERRERALHRLGLDVPVFSNQGGKGALVKRFSAAHHAPVIFIDDLPLQHRSVAEHAPHVHRIHMVGEPSLVRLIDRAADCQYRCDLWADCADLVLELLSSETHCGLRQS